MLLRRRHCGDESGASVPGCTTLTSAVCAIHDATITMAMKMKKSVTGSGSALPVRSMRLSQRSDQVGAVSVEGDSEAMAKRRCGNGARGRQLSC
jgi:hypothetical protein